MLRLMKRIFGSDASGARPSKYSTVKAMAACGHRTQGDIDQALAAMAREGTPAELITAFSRIALAARGRMTAEDIALLSTEGIRTEALRSPDQGAVVVEAWENEDSCAFVWGTHDPEVAHRAFLEHLNDVLDPHDLLERVSLGVPDWSEASQLWGNRDLIQLESWPAEFISAEPRPGYVPFLSH